MSDKDIWYGMLEAGEKSSPVVRDNTLDASEGKVYLYNYSRNQFIEYAKAIVEPKLRDLATDDISQNDLDKAFKSARQEFTSSRKSRSWSDDRPASSTKAVEDDSMDIDMSDDDFEEEFIDDDN